MHEVASVQSKGQGSEGGSAGSGGAGAGRRCDGRAGQLPAGAAAGQGVRVGLLVAQVTGAARTTASAAAHAPTTTGSTTQNIYLCAQIFSQRSRKWWNSAEFTMDVVKHVSRRASRNSSRGVPSAVGRSSSRRMRE